jgi:hypothetical protein
MELTLSMLPELLAICRLEPNATLPPWTMTGRFIAITRTPEELSIVCPAAQVPGNVPCQRGWRCFKVEGRLDFALTGILASLATPLAAAEISIFALSTYDTDYLMVREVDSQRAVAVLSEAGHRIRG